MNDQFPFNSAEVNEFQGFDPVESSKKPKRTFSIASLVLGIISVAGCCLCCCIPVMFVCGILAIVFAILSKKENENKKMSGMAIAGLILGVVGIVLVIVFTLLMVVWLAPIGSMSDEELLVFFEENFKPFMTEEEYATFIEDLGIVTESVE